MSYSISISGHVEDEAQVPVSNAKIKDAVDTLVQTLRDADVPISTAILNLPTSGDTGGTTNYMAEADPDPGAPPATTTA